MMKICTKCLGEKPLSAFAFRNKAQGTYASNCKQCQKGAKDSHYRRNKAAYIAKSRARRIEYNARWREFKSGLSCSECGQNHPATLDFHHPDRKEHSVSDLLRGEVGWDKLMDEVEKCIVLCSNCHRILHYTGRSSSG